MGGMITSMTAIDSRLKAVAPFVGGTAYLYKDFPGIPGSETKYTLANMLTFMQKLWTPLPIGHMSNVQ